MIIGLIICCIISLIIGFVVGAGSHAQAVIGKETVVTRLVPISTESYYHQLKADIIEVASRNKVKYIFDKDGVKWMVAGVGQDGIRLYKSGNTEHSAETFIWDKFTSQFPDHPSWSPFYKASTNNVVIDATELEEIKGMARQWIAVQEEIGPQFQELENILKT